MSAGFSLDSQTSSHSSKLVVEEVSGVHDVTTPTSFVSFCRFQQTLETLNKQTLNLDGQTGRQMDGRIYSGQHWLEALARRLWFQVSALQVRQC